MINADPPARAVIFEIQSYIDGIEQNKMLREEHHFDQRLDVIDSLGSQVIDRIGELLHKSNTPHKLNLLKSRAEKLMTELEEIDIKLFKKLRTRISRGLHFGKEFKNLIREYFPLSADTKEPVEEAGYNNLDIFINELLGFERMPAQTLELEPDMVYYQKTPAKIILELVEMSCLSMDDIFVDLGSGLGQVVILVNLLTGIKSHGIEFEPAFYDYARNKASELHLPGATFTHDDARNADYSMGNVFFMFTPFRGEVLQEVLAILKKESLKRKIKIISYGPCTTEIANQRWLSPITPNNDNIYKLAVFGSSQLSGEVI
jgi:hypothetical protein